MSSFFTDLFRRRTPKVACNAVEIALQDARGRQTKLRLDELREIVVVTTDGGPFTEDFFWVLVAEGREMVVPSEAQGAEELLLRLQALPGFDHEALLSAVCSVDDARFPVWVNPGVPLVATEGGNDAP